MRKILLRSGGSRDSVVSKADLKRLLTELPFVRSYGFVVQSVASGECVLSVPFQRVFERPGGIVSGLVFMAAADVAMWLAIKTLLGMDEACVTRDEDQLFVGGKRGGLSLPRQDPEVG